MKTDDDTTDEQTSSWRGSALRRLAVLAISGALGVGIATAAVAQDPKPPVDRAHHGERLKNMTKEEKETMRKKHIEKRLEKMKQHLDLTEAQAAEIKKIFSDATEQRKAKKRERRKAHRRFRAQKREMRRQMHEKVKAVLDDEQEQKLEEHFENRARRHLERRVHRLDEALDLSDSQEAEVEAIVEQAHREVRTIVEGASADDNVRKQIRAVKKQAADDIEAVLDADQAETFQELKERRKRRRGHRGRRGGPRF